MRIGKWETTTQRHISVAAETCDICGGPLCPHRGWDGSDVTIQASIGEVYPECDMRTVTECDVCPECFEAKVVPALEALGVVWRRHDAECDSKDMFNRVEGTE